MKNNMLKTIAFGTLSVLAFAPLAQAQVTGSVTGTADVQVTPVKVGGYSVTVKGEDDGAGSEREGGEGEDNGKMEDGARAEKPEVKNEREGSTEEKGVPTLYREESHDRDGEGDEALKHIQLRLETKDLLSNDNNNETGTTSTEVAGTSSQMMVRNAAEVHTEAELKNFVRTRAQEDQALKQVEVADGTVSVTYDEPAELFGFINTKIATHVNVDQAGNVEVTYPWYHIFMKKHASRASIQSDIARALAAENKAGKEGMASTTASASTTQATIAAGLGIPNIFEIIANSLKSARVTGEASMQ